MANGLIHNAERPTYIFKTANGKTAEGYGKRGSSDGVADHLLFATDFSRDSEVAFNYLVEMKPLVKKKISLVHIQTSTGYLLILTARSKSSTG
jgi:hypothetical protein